MMPRKVRIHPSLTGGEPQDQDEYNEEEQLHGRVEMDDRDSENDEESTDEDDRYAAMQRDIEALKRENALLTRAIPPARPTAPVVEEDEDPDWDQLLFTNPKEALRLHGERIERKVKQELRQEYQQEQGTQSFWKDFYKANEDLKEDNDLVESTLSKHMDELANLPVNKAMERLGDLTRKRIMKYSKRDGERPRTRAIVEGGGAPQGRAPAKQDSNITTLGDLLKARRAKRRGATAA